MEQLEGEEIHTLRVATAMVFLRAEKLAQPTDSIGERRPNSVAGVQGREYAATGSDLQKPPPTGELEALFEQQPRQMEIPRQLLWRDRLGARTRLAVSLGL